MQMKKYIALLSVFFILPSIAFGIELPEEVRELLHAAEDTGGYQVSVLERETEKRIQTVVILGETHLKPQKAGLIGKKLLEYFHLFGLESIGVQQMQPNHIGPFLTLMHPLSALCYFGTQCSERSTIEDVIFPYEMSEEEKLILGFLLIYDMRPSIELERIHTALKAEFDRNSKFRNWCSDIGIPDDLVQSLDSLPEFMTTVRKKIFGDITKEVVMLEQFEPLPEEIKKWNDSIGKSAQAIKGCGVLLGAAALAYLGGKYVRVR
jgi:hypothetical protein